MLTSTALVLFMTLPGLALFYGGLVRTKNVLSVLMQCFAIAGVVTVLWVVGRLLARVRARRRRPRRGHRRPRQGVPRGRRRAASLTRHDPRDRLRHVPVQFAIITPALIIGAFAERMRSRRCCSSSALWSLVVYCRVAHWVWGGRLARSSSARSTSPAGPSCTSPPASPALVRCARTRQAPRLSRRRRCRRTA